MALILLRLCAATALVCPMFSPHPSPPPLTLYVLSGVLALALTAGAIVPVCCVATAALQLLVGGWPSSADVVVSVVHAIALACLGAGAYSLDAIRYGRRVVIVPRDH